MVQCNKMEYLMFNIMAVTSYVSTSHDCLYYNPVLLAQLFNGIAHVYLYILSIICLLHRPFSAFPYQQETHLHFSMNTFQTKIYTLQNRPQRSSLYSSMLLCFCRVFGHYLLFSRSIYHIHHHLSIMMVQTRCLSGIYIITRCSYTSLMCRDYNSKTSPLRQCIEFR